MNTWLWLGLWYLGGALISFIVCLIALFVDWWKGDDIEIIKDVLEIYDYTSIGIKSCSFYGGFDRYIGGFEEAKDNFQLSFIQLNDPLLEQIKDEIINTDINTLTPVEALMKLNEIKKLLKK